MSITRKSGPPATRVVEGFTVETMGFFHEMAGGVERHLKATECCKSAAVAVADHWVQAASPWARRAVCVDGDSSGAHPFMRHQPRGNGPPYRAVSWFAAEYVLVFVQVVTRATIEVNPFFSNITPQFGNLRPLQPEPLLGDKVTWN